MAHCMLDAGLWEGDKKEAAMQREYLPLSLLSPLSGQPMAQVCTKWHNMSTPRSSSPLGLDTGRMEHRGR
jgi:hypothetical protein